MESETQLAAPKVEKSKEEALEACAEHHLALVQCFKTCSLWSAFTGCCVEEHKRFWGCYTEERGSNATKISAWLDEKLGSGSPAQQRRQQEEVGHSGSSRGGDAQKQ